MSRIRVEGHSHLLKDMGTGALINTNKAALDAFVRAKAAREREDARIERLENDIATIKMMLEKIING